MSLPSAVVDVFKQEKTADNIQRRLETLLARETHIENIATWVQIFNSSDTLGKFYDNAPHIRGRAGEMITKYIILHLQSVSKSLKNSKLYHSFHYNGTEQDILLLTDRCIYLIEVKAKKADNYKDMSTGQGKKGISQNDMHKERFDKFLEQTLKYKYAVPIETYLVYVMSKNKDKAEIIDGTTLLPAQRLFKQLCESYYKVNKNNSIRDFDYLLHLFEGYVKSGSEKAEESAHKRRLGYE